MTSPRAIAVSCIVGCMLILGAAHTAAQARSGAPAPGDQLQGGRRGGGPGPGDAAVQGGRRGGGPADQATAQMPSDPFTGPVVTGAPYSGDTSTTITQTLGDGTRIEERTEAKFYRDSAGRVRREETVIGLGPLNPAAQTQTVVTIDPTPEDMFAYTLDPNARTARRVQRSAPAVAALGDALNALNGLRVRRTDLSLSVSAPGARGATPPGRGAGQPVEESLGTRQMEGVRVSGRKTTSTIPTGAIGNDRPIVITDERWESPDLKVLVYSRFSDPRTGVVEFRLTNIVRTEQPLILFTVPSDYTVIEPGAGGRGRGGPAPDAPPPPPPAPGARGGRAGRGPQ